MAIWHALLRSAFIRERSRPRTHARSNLKKSAARLGACTGTSWPWPAAHALAVPRSQTLQPSTRLHVRLGLGLGGRAVGGGAVRRAAHGRQLCRDGGRRRDGAGSLLARRCQLGACCACLVRELTRARLRHISTRARLRRPGLCLRAATGMSEPGWPPHRLMPAVRVRFPFTLQLSSPARGRPRERACALRPDFTLAAAWRLLHHGPPAGSTIILAATHARQGQQVAAPGAALRP